VFSSRPSIEGTAQEMTTISVAFLSLVSVGIGALITHFLTHHRSRLEDLAAFRLKAYGDFIGASSVLIAARRMGRIEDEIDELAKLNDAKARICICAEPPIIEALSEFWKSGGTLELEHEILAFTRLCMRIRESLGNKKNDILSSDISDTLFKLEPSTYSYKLKKRAQESAAENN
jgi:hypothetical protein